MTEERAWECGAFDGERLGYVCGRPKDHKGMHRRRTPLPAPPAAEADALDTERLWRAIVKVAEGKSHHRIYTGWKTVSEIAAEYNRLARAGKDA